MFHVKRLLTILLAIFAFGIAIPAAIASSRPDIGVLQSTPERASQMRAAGLTVAQIGVAWNRFEPQRGQFDAKYINEIRETMARFRKADQKLILDFGIQYPPTWVLALPNVRYVNQNGTAYVDASPGKNVANAVFNQSIRDLQATYVGRVFKELGTDWKAIRLGWGWYGELHLPKNVYGEEKNSYWAFDAIAQGKTAGLPSGIKPCPVPDWKPGTPSPEHRDARSFVEWYFEAHKDYLNWQIATVRLSYQGELTVLFPGWGIRPGHAEAAIQNDLNGTTVAERGGDMAEALDYARLVNSIRDKNVQLYTTWLDAPWGNDAGTDVQHWTPIRYLKFLADGHPLKFSLGGENTGGANTEDLQRTITRTREYNLALLLWAFEGQLFDKRFASFESFQSALKANDLTATQ